MLLKLPSPHIYVDHLPLLQQAGMNSFYLISVWDGIFVNIVQLNGTFFTHSVRWNTLLSSFLLWTIGAVMTTASLLFYMLMRIVHIHLVKSVG